MVDLTRLDSRGIQTFIETTLAEFLAEFEKIRKDDPNSARALKTMLAGTATPETLDENQFAAIGLMAADDSVHGQSLIKTITTVAGSVDDEMAANHTLFKDIDRDLRETVKTLLTTQDTNLSSIDGEKFLDIFTDVDDDLGSKTTSTSGNS
ncbi:MULTISPECIES: type VII secretion system-associated protein [Streptomyces]|uniref:Type VII secretion system-associated protein n=2 Tax=Streptomyces TaxID=1883 RepID=A0ABV9IM59_9ACTN